MTSFVHNTLLNRVPATAVTLRSWKPILSDTKWDEKKRPTDPMTGRHKTSPGLEGIQLTSQQGVQQCLQEFVPEATGGLTLPFGFFSVATRFTLMLVQLRIFKRIGTSEHSRYIPTAGGVHRILQPHGRIQSGIGVADLVWPQVLWCLDKSDGLTL